MRKRVIDRWVQLRAESRSSRIEAHIYFDEVSLLQRWSSTWRVMASRSNATDETCDLEHPSGYLRSSVLGIYKSASLLEVSFRDSTPSKSCDRPAN